MRKRGDRFRNPKPVLAVFDGGAIRCDSMSEAMAVFHIPSTSTLSRLIRNGRPWKDGTCFDWALTDPV